MAQVQQGIPQSIPRPGGVQGVGSQGGLLKLVRAAGGKNWFQRLEHPVLRVVALIFSFWSAHAIRWIFSPLDGIDTIEPAMIWAAAVAFGLLGFFVSRGIVYRLMNKDPGCPISRSALSSSSSRLWPTTRRPLPTLNMRRGYIRCRSGNKRP